MALPEPARFSTLIGTQTDIGRCCDTTGNALLRPKRSTLSGGIVETENLSVRVFLLARFLGQPKSLQSRGLFTNDLCLDFVAHREIVILPSSLLQPRLHSRVLPISGHRPLLLRAQKRDPITFTQYVYARNAMKQGPAHT